MFGFGKKKTISEERVAEVETPLTVGVVTRSNTKPKRIDSSGKEYTLSNNTAPSSEQAITTSEVVFTCVDFIASSVALARFTAYTRDAKTQTKVPYNNKAVIKSLNVSPSPTSSWTELLGIAATQILLDGETFITMELVAKQFEFTVIDSDTTVEILFDELHPEIPTGYSIGETDYSLEEMVHVKRANIKGDLHGQSVLSSLINTLVIDGYASDDLLSLYENGSVPESYLSSEMPLAPSQVSQIENMLTTKYNRAGRHKTMVLPNGLKPTSLKINPKDAVVLEAMTLSEDRIIRAFKLHKAVLGGNIESYTNNIEGLSTIQFNNAVRPIISMIKDKLEMTLRLKLKKDDLYIDIDYRNLPEISRALTVHIESARSMYSSGLASLNESREVIGLPALDNPLANENFLPEFLHGSSLMSIQGLDETQLSIIREAKVAEAQKVIDGETPDDNKEEPMESTEPPGSDNPEGGTPNNDKETN